GQGGGGETLKFFAADRFFSNGSLDVSGVGFGDGGVLVISSQAAGTFRIGTNASQLGIKGIINANAGSLGGDGGSITLHIPNADPSVAGGTTIGANATGSLAFNGGALDLVIQNLATSGSGPLTLSANGSGAGNGGSVRYEITKPSKTVTVGPGSGQLVISATGGSSGSIA